MKKKYLFLSSVGLAAFVLTSCGGNGLGTKISTADAKAIAKKFDARGEDIVMGSETIKASINSFSFGGNGIIGYTNPDEGILLENYHVNNASFSIDKQEIADITIPNTLLGMLEPILGKISEMSAVTNIPYLLSATISEPLIDAYIGYVDVSGKEKGWDNLSANFYKKQTKDKNEAISATIEIKDIIKFVDEYAAAGFDVDNLPFKGEGSFSATVSSDDLGYINQLSFAVKGNNIQIDTGVYKEENKNDFDPGIIDPFFKDGTKIMGCNITGNVDINISLSVTHNEATQKTIKFYRQNKVKNKDGAYIDDGNPVEITDLEKDDVLEFFAIKPVKTDPLTKKDYYGKKNIAYDGISYEVGFKSKDSKYKIGYDVWQSKLAAEEDCFSLSYGGFVVTPKPREKSSMFDFAYRYFDHEGLIDNEYIDAFHCGKNVIHELNKLGDANLEITINAFKVEK